METLVEMVEIEELVEAVALVALVVMVVQEIHQLLVEMEELVFKFHRHSEIQILK